MSIPVTNLNQLNGVNHTPGTPNVVGINNVSASIKILNYLEDRKRKSKNTYQSYVRYFNTFFMFACGKQITEITWEDMLGITTSKVDDFKRYLLEKGDSANTTSQKILACKALFKRLHAFNYNIDYENVFDIEFDDIEVNSYAALTEADMELLFNFMDNEEFRPLTKRLFFESLYTIGCRKTAALELEWSQIIQKRDHKAGIDVWVVKFRDKGKTIEKALNDDFMAKLLQLKESDENTGKGKVFQIHKDTIERVFDKFQKKCDLYERDGKKVTIHSIKKAGAWRVQNAFGDVKKTRNFCQHKNVQLTISTYTSESYTEQASYMIGKDVDMDFFKGLDKDMLIKLINACGKDVQLKMYYEWEKMNRQ